MVDDRAFGGANHNDFFKIRDVYKKSRTLLFGLEGFGMTRELNRGGGLLAVWHECGESAVAVANPGGAGVGIQADVVGVRHVRQRKLHLEGGGVEHLERAVFPVGDEEFVAIGEEQDTLR